MMCQVDNVLRNLNKGSFCCRRSICCRKSGSCVICASLDQALVDTIGRCVGQHVGRVLVDSRSLYWLTCSSICQSTLDLMVNGVSADT